MTAADLAPAGRPAACARCGFVHEPGARFCGGCGQPIVAGAAIDRFAAPEAYTPSHLAEKIRTSRGTLEGERKQVTVLFADMKGSLELLADRDPEDARRMLDPVLTAMMEAVHRYEGTVNQVLGDGVMAIFGPPLAHENHAVRAAYAALRMHGEVQRLARDLRRAEGVDVQIRVGLNSGEVVVSAIGSDLHMDYTAVGQTTYLAAQGLPSRSRCTCGSAGRAARVTVWMRRRAHTSTRPWTACTGRSERAPWRPRSCGESSGRR